MLPGKYELFSTVRYGAFTGVSASAIRRPVARVDNSPTASPEGRFSPLRLPQNVLFTWYARSCGADSHQWVLFHGHGYAYHHARPSSCR
jgi:hypothetical protein